jgi:uncharacterized membrane protein YsdA (DUF1294 family)
MKWRSFASSVVAAVVLVMAGASGAAAQQPASPAPHSHLWRDVLIGGAVGTGFGGGIGAMRKNFHDNECAVLSCHRVLEAGTLIPIGAAAGAFGGWLTHVVLNHGDARSSHTASPVASSTAAPRQPTFLLTPTYSPNRKSIQLRAQF